MKSPFLIPQIAAGLSSISRRLRHAISGAAASHRKASLIAVTAFGALCLAATLAYLRHSQTVQDETLIQFHHSPVMMPIPGGALGPESFAFDSYGGGPYTGVSDGRIIRWLANESRWVDFAVTSPSRDGCEGYHDHSQLEHKCGRPLGLKFSPTTGDLYIADAYMGLLVVGPNGGLAQQVARDLEGVPFGLTNSLDIDPYSGAVYFTDSSTRFRRRNYVSIMISGDNSGRLMKFDPKTTKTSLILKNLKFPNGVSLSKNGEFLLFVETTTCRLYKLWLKTAKAGNVELIIEFNGFPDNIKRNVNGEFWIGINSRRGSLLRWLISNPWIGNILMKVSPIDVTKAHSYVAYLLGGTGMGIKLDENGNVVEVLDSTKGKQWKFVSEVEQQNGNLWIGSVTRSFALQDRDN